MSAPTKSSGKPGYRQLNARLPEQLVAEINAYAQARGVFRDETVERILREALAQADRRTSADGRSLKVEFSFPDPIRAACERYLVYFGEFLRDAGVEVTTALAEKAGAVLFSVTPVNPKVALANILEALTIYLTLPQNPITRVPATAPLAERKLEDIIDHLHHQLELLNVTAVSQQLRLKDKDATIRAQRRLISKLEAVPSTVEAVPKATNSREEFLGGSFALTKVEKAGVEFNLAQIFRHLRTLFKLRKGGKTA